MGIFSDTQGQVTHKSLIGFWSHFKPIREFVGVLVACKNEEDPIKMKALEWSQYYSLIFQTLKGS